MLQNEQRLICQKGLKISSSDKNYVLKNFHVKYVKNINIEKGFSVYI